MLVSASFSRRPLSAMARHLISRAELATRGILLSLPTTEMHQIVVQRLRVKVLELDDALFKTASAVMMPEGRTPDGSRSDPTGIGLLAACLRYAEEHPNEKLFITGHADTTAGDDINIPLSRKRAQCVHAIVSGDRRAFVTIAKGQHVAEDRDDILRWASKLFGWPCDPDNYASAPSTAAYHFHRAYNRDERVRTTKVQEAWVFTDQSWGAIFDCYQYQLAILLGFNDTTAFSFYREASLRFLDVTRPWTGCGEAHPIEEPLRDQYRSSTNRRVEMLFFIDEPGTLGCAAGACARCRIYDSLFFKRVVLPQMPSALPWTAFWENPATPAIAGTTRDMLVSTDGLPDGTPLSFQLELKAGENTYTVGDPQVANAVAQNARKTNELWFDDGLAVSRVDVSAQIGFPLVQFRFVAEGACRRVESPWLDYCDRLHLRFLHRHQRNRRLANTDYVCFSPWGVLRGKTNIEGDVVLDQLPPGGALLLLPDFNIYSESSSSDHRVAFETQYRVPAADASNPAPPYPTLVCFFRLGPSNRQASKAPISATLTYLPSKTTQTLGCSPLYGLPPGWRGQLEQRRFQGTLHGYAVSPDGALGGTVPCGSRLNTAGPHPVYVEDHFLVVGHRGSPAVEVENTLPSYQRALRVDGANALEIDLCLTADGQVIVWHDWDPNDTVALFRQGGWEPGTSCRPLVPGSYSPDQKYRRKVSELTLAEIREHFGYTKKTILGLSDERAPASIPTFDEFVRWACGEPQLQWVLLDMKIPRSEPAAVAPMMASIAASMRVHGAHFRAVTLCPEESIHDLLRKSPGWHSLDHEVGLSFEMPGDSAVLPAIRRGNRVASVGRPVFVLDGASSNFEFLMRIVGPDLAKRDSHNADPANISIARYMVWTIDDEEEMKILVSAGIDGMLSNRPARVRETALTQNRVVDW